MRWDLPNGFDNFFNNAISAITEISPQKLLTIAVDEIFRTANDYLNKKNKAQELGKNFSYYTLNKIDCRDTPINLIGFSLGARVIHFALLNNYFHEYNLNNVILLGGCYFQ